jgi:hypothetical protein
MQIYRELKGSGNEGDIEVTETFENTPSFRCHGNMVTSLYVFTIDNAKKRHNGLF